jgi:hypothetical protein
MLTDSERSQAGRNFRQHKVSNEPVKTRLLRQGLMNIDNQQQEMLQHGLNNAAVNKKSTLHVHDGYAKVSISERPQTCPIYVSTAYYMNRSSYASVSLLDISFKYEVLQRSHVI